MLNLLLEKMITAAAYTFGCLFTALLVLTAVCWLTNITPAAAILLLLN